MVHMPNSVLIWLEHITCRVYIFLITLRIEANLPVFLYKTYIFLESLVKHISYFHLITHTV